MPRAATTTDAFNAIAEPRRREIIEALADGEPRSVNELVDRLKLAQPAVSKHLGVLRQVGIVSVSKEGQHRMYRLNGGELKAVYDWTKTFEKFWSNQLARIKQRAERFAKEQSKKKS
jgi:DNA-binding transcriptional ArsR family regulator